MTLPLSDLRVLLVDDMPQAAKLLQMVFNGIGIHQVFVAKDGMEAQEFLDAADEPMDLIVCDWQMPRMTGLELHAQVRTTFPQMPFMMVTGNAEAESVRAAIALGVNAYITKPFSPAQVQEKLMALINSIENKMDLAS
jgi:two-component system chemotaxis response regulator CheY